MIRGYSPDEQRIKLKVRELRRPQDALRLLRGYAYTSAEGLLAARWLHEFGWFIPAVYANKLGVKAQRKRRQKKRFRGYNWRQNRSDKRDLRQEFIEQRREAGKEDGYVRERRKPSKTRRKTKKDAKKEKRAAEKLGKKKAREGDYRYGH